MIRGLNGWNGPLYRSSLETPKPNPDPRNLKLILSPFASVCLITGLKLWPNFSLVILPRDGIDSAATLRGRHRDYGQW